MKDMARLLEKWQLNVGDVREQMYRAPTPRERERWHGLWLLVQGWSVTQVAEALEGGCFIVNSDTHLPTQGWPPALPRRGRDDTPYITYITPCGIPADHSRPPCEVGVGAAVSRTGYPEAVSGDPDVGQDGQLVQAGVWVVKVG